MSVKFKRWRSTVHLQKVADLKCCLCGEYAQAHHINGHGTGKMGGKCSDSKAIPLCNLHHTGIEGVHTLGVETWESHYGKQEDHLMRTLIRLVEK